jgi:hypothetical protein
MNDEEASMHYAWLTCTVAVLGSIVMLATPAAWAANCGDTAGPGGIRVACACGDTIVTDTTLKSTDPVVSTGPGDVCPSHGLLTGMPDLTLDCKGLTLRGSGGVFVGVRDDYAGTTIQGCVLVAFHWGVLTVGAQSRVLNTKVVGAVHGIYLRGADQHAERNQLEGNTAGIDVDPTFGVGSVITGNRAIGNGTGIRVLGAGALISGNITDGNATFGIDVVLGTSHVLEANRGKDNGSHGIKVSVSGNTLRRNVYDTNGGHGICAVAGNIDGGGNRGTGNALQPDVDFTCVP